jgi:hypothetical protein
MLNNVTDWRSPGKLRVTAIAPLTVHFPGFFERGGGFDFVDSLSHSSRLSGFFSCCCNFSIWSSQSFFGSELTPPNSSIQKFRSRFGSAVGDAKFREGPIWRLGDSSCFRNTSLSIPIPRRRRIAFWIRWSLETTVNRRGAEFWLISFSISSSAS